MCKKSNRFVICFLVLAVVFSFSVSATEAPIHWYCVRNKEHKQPKIDGNMAFIEEYQGYYVDRKHGDNSEDKVVYLTFDAGYENGNIEKILDVLKDEQVSGAFFILGNLIERNPEIVLRMSKEGHLVCNHSDRHKDMTSYASMEEMKGDLSLLEKKYSDLTGKKMSPYYRPPEGKFDERTMKYASELGYKTIFWSFAYADWDNDRQPDPQIAKEKILSNMHNGAVLLLHPTSATNATILGEIISTLRQSGYRFGTLEELTAPLPQPR